MDTFRFPELPPEIQNVILASNRESLQKSQVLSPQHRNLTIEEFMNQHILDPPTEIELREYLRVIPYIYLALDYGYNLDNQLFKGYVNIYYNENGGSNEFFSQVLILYKQIDGTSLIVMEKEDSTVLTSNYVLDMLKYPIYGPLVYDLATMEWVIDRRLRSLNLSNEERKKQTIKHLLTFLNRIYDMFQEHLLPYLFIYLYYNALIFDLPVEDEENYVATQMQVGMEINFNYHDPNDKNGVAISEYVNTLYPRIYSYIKNIE